MADMVWNQVAEGIIEMAKQGLIGNVLSVVIGFLEDDDYLLYIHMSKFKIKIK